MPKDIDNESLSYFFESYRIGKFLFWLRRSQVINAFNDYVNENSFSRWYLALYKFATVRPLSYIRRESINQLLKFFNEHPQLTLEAIRNSNVSLSHAIFSSLRPGTSWTKEHQLTVNQPRQMVEFETTWHPEYQRYSEHIFNHLINLPLHILGKINNKDYLSLTLANRVMRLQDNNLEEVTIGFDSVVRNAISHGKTEFELSGLKYIDKKDKPPQYLTAQEFAALFDNLVDTCHSILVALLLFLCENQSLAKEFGLSHLPVGLRFIFIDSFISHPGFKLLLMMESVHNENKKQLNISCSIETRARYVTLIEGFRTCWETGAFGGEIYNRYYASFDCGLLVPSGLILNGDRLQSAIKNKETFDSCATELIEPLSPLWYDSRRFPNLAINYYEWKSIFLLLWEILKQDWKKRMIESGSPSSRYTVLETVNKSSEVYRQIEAHLILHEKGTITAEHLNNIIEIAIGRLKKYKTRKTDRYGEKGIAKKPDYIKIRLYSERRRKRTVMAYDWKDRNLVLIAEWSSPKEKQRPYDIQNSDFSFNNIQIKYNPNLITEPESRINYISNKQTLS